MARNDCTELLETPTRRPRLPTATAMPMTVKLDRTPAADHVFQNERIESHEGLC